MDTTDIYYYHFYKEFYGEEIVPDKDPEIALDNAKLV
jgi:hypothetical protein